MHKPTNVHKWLTLMFFYFVAFSSMFINKITHALIHSLIHLLFRLLLNLCSIFCKSHATKFTVKLR